MTKVFLESLTAQFREEGLKNTGALKKAYLRVALAMTDLQIAIIKAEMEGDEAE